MKNFHISCYYSLKWWWRLTVGNHQIVKISKVRCIDFSLYLGLILWLLSWVIKVIFNQFAFNHEIRDLFWDRRGMIFMSGYLPFLLCLCIILSMTYSQGPVDSYGGESEVSFETELLEHENREALSDALQCQLWFLSAYILNDWSISNYVVVPWKWRHSQKSGVLLPCPLNPSNTPSIIFFLIEA